MLNGMSQRSRDRSPLVDRLVTTCASTARSIVEVESGQIVTFAALLEQASSLAARLCAAGGELRGARVLLAGPPGIAWARGFFATLLAGGSVVPIPLGAPAAECERIGRDAKARLALAVDPSCAQVPPGVVRLSPDEWSGPPLQQPAPAAFDPALLLFTSGTTGKPKGAVLSHASLHAQTSALRSAWGFREDDVLLHVLPMHHLHGIVVAFLTAFTTPCDLRLSRKFEVATVIADLGRARVFMAVPTMYQRILEWSDRTTGLERERFAKAARGLRLATSGSAALPASLAERWRELAGCIPLERYGMTEIGMALSNPLDPAARKVGSVGVPLPTVEIRIVDELGSDVDGPGELWVRGPSVMSGYFEHEEATAAAHRDGWFTTGDVAVRDSEGRYRLLGRMSADILKTGGEKVSALEIEELLREHEAIAEVAVVGVPDPAWGERVVAVVVPRPGAEGRCSTQVLRAWAKDRMSPFKVPREVRVVSELPRNAMGKVMKQELLKALE